MSHQAVPALKIKHSPKASIRSQQGKIVMHLLSALIQVEEDDAEVWFFLAPEGGGTKLKGGVQVVTPASPLGRALLGKRAGDEVELKLAGKTRLLCVLDVS